MLIKIQCDKFKFNHNEVRPPIEFNVGLNIIEGAYSGTNSIGKSTFLMCIDFAFGGNDYVDKLKTIKKKIGDHVIQFAFKFGEETLYFSRATNNHKIVNKCDSNFNVLSSMPLDDFTELLKLKYKIQNREASFRDLASRFFRIYNRGNIDETLPLRGFSNESPTSSVEALFRIFNKYDSIRIQKEAYKLSDDKKTTFKSAGDYEFIPNITKTKYDNNLIRIEELRALITELADKSDKGILELDSQKSEELSQIDSKIKTLKRERSLQFNKIDVLKKDKELSKIDIQKDFEELLRFFPDLNIERLIEVESFHNKLSGILKKELTSQESKVWATINYLSAQIEELEKRKLELGCVNKVSKIVLNKHAELSKELELLLKENECYEKFQLLKNQSSADKKILDETILEEGAKLAEIINKKMAEISELVFPNYQAPILTITKTGNYDFFTPDDEGTGTNYKGLILFDLAVLLLTEVPALAHDSVLVKNISQVITENIYKVYNSMQKQVFAVVDRADTYNVEMQKIIDKHRVLYLSEGGNELFGFSWAKKTEVEDDKND